VFLVGSEAEQDNFDVRAWAKKFSEATSSAHDAGHARQGNSPKDGNADGGVRNIREKVAA
jgi:hypothetical protein